MKSSLPTAAVLVLLCAFLMLTPIATPAADTGEAEFAKGWDLLKQRQYQEARAALEAGMKKNPSNALAHFYLAESCRGLKDWPCAEEHYETSLELDAKSSVADLAKQRGRKAKVWRLLDEGRQAITEANAPPEKLAKAKDTLDVANKLGLDDEQQAVYRQLQEKLQAGSKSGLDKSAMGEAKQEPGAQAQEMPMVLVPAGEFIMGSQAGDPDEQPAHRVYLDAYYMDKFEVTVGMYDAFLKAAGMDPPPDWEIMNKAQHQRRPVVNVDWADAATYCKWAGKRLPTEAEWEKAARGTDGRTYPWGNDPPTRLHANYGKEKWNDHGALVPVGALDDGKSPYGIYDMAGNVWEWTSDWYDKSYYRNSPAQNPKGAASGETKVVRGGSWFKVPQDLRSASRVDGKRSGRLSGNGFRCAKTP